MSEYKDEVSDKDIEEFVRKNESPVVVVQGLGFVGAVMSLICANALHADYNVIGVDLATKDSLGKIKSINDGIFPIVSEDPKVEIYYKEVRKKGNLLATCNKLAYSFADVVIVDINLDVSKTSSNNGDLEAFDVDMSNFRSAISTIGMNCKADVLIIVETTVPPGTCQKIVKPILYDCFAKRGLSTTRLHIGHSYERVMPGKNYIDSIQNFYRVFSGIDDKSADATEAFLKTIISTDEYPLTKLANTNATEMSKVLENSFRAMNIAFIEEWSRFAELAQVDLFEVISAIRLRPTHKNIMKPGIGVGGYCLTKDPLLASWASTNLFNSDNHLAQSITAVEINDRMPINTFKYFERGYQDNLSGKRLLIAGLSYRENVGDTRFTPVAPFYNLSLKAGCEVEFLDPYLTNWDDNDVVIHNDIMSLSEKVYDILVISCAHNYFNQDNNLLLYIQSNPHLFIFDSIGFFNSVDSNKLPDLNNYLCIGRGNQNGLG